MNTAGEKLDFLIKEVKTLQSNQLKVHTAVEGLTKWSSDADKIAVDLSNDIKGLTSRIAALEALSSTPTPEAPPREEGGWAKGHRVDHSYQGDDVGTPLPHHSLVKGKQTNSSAPFTLNFHDGGPKNELVHAYPYQKEYRLPKTGFPRFDGEHPRIWKENSEKYYAMYKVPMKHVGSFCYHAL
jgi:hypothetical protein